MKRNFFTTTLLVFSGIIAANVAPLHAKSTLNTRGIPADVVGFFQVNVADLLDSSLVQSATGRSKKFLESMKKEAANDLWRALGVSEPLKKITSATIGFKIIEKGRGPEPFIYIVRGNFVPSEILEALTQPRDKVSNPRWGPGTRMSIGKYSFVSIDGGRHLVGIYDANTIILTLGQEAGDSLATAKSVLAALEGSAKCGSYVVPAALVAHDRNIAKPLWIAHLDDVSWPNHKRGFLFLENVAPPKRVSFALGTSDSVCQLRFDMGYDTVAEAREALSSVKNFLAKSEAFVSKEIDATTKEEDLNPMIRFFKAVKLEVVEKNLTLTVDYPESEFHKLLSAL